MGKSISWLHLATGWVVGLSVGLMMTPLVTSNDEPHIALWLQIVNQVSSSASSLATLVALIFVVRQFKLATHQSELLRKNINASMDNVLYARLDSFNRFIVEHHTIYEMLNSTEFGEEPANERARLHHLCDLAFSFYEEVFKHHSRYQFLHPEDRDEWNSQMQHFFGKRYVQGYWEQVSLRYSRSFQSVVSEMLEVAVLRIAA